MDPKDADDPEGQAARRGFDPCAAARPHFSDQLDGQPLPLATSLLVRMHLTICPPCRRLHRSLVATRDALAALRDADPSGLDGPAGAPAEKKDA